MTLTPSKTRSIYLSSISTTSTSELKTRNLFLFISLYSTNISSPLNRNVILGERIPFNENGRRIYKNKKRYTEESLELSRLMQNQSTEIHNRVKKKIKDLYKGISDDDVSYLKATLYKMIRQKNPSLGKPEILKMNFVLKLNNSNNSIGKDVINCTTK